jgi:hypothetical protein
MRHRVADQAFAQTDPQFARDDLDHVRCFQRIGARAEDAFAQHLTASLRALSRSRRNLDEICVE